MLYVHLNILTYCKIQRSFRLSSALNKEITSVYKKKMAKLYLLPIGIIVLYRMDRLFSNFHIINL